MPAMGEFYFRVASFEKIPADFLNLFPPTDRWSPALAESFQLMVASQIAICFRAAAELGIPDRPDLACRLWSMSRMLRMDLLEVPNNVRRILESSAKYGFLRELVRKPRMIESNPALEKFYRDQWFRHFADFSIPFATGDEQDQTLDSDVL
ncbi:MAG: hypothetical protein WCH98_19505 [Verrucomicrobiota bacterium]